MKHMQMNTILCQGQFGVVMNFHDPGTGEHGQTNASKCTMAPGLISATTALSLLRQSTLNDLLVNHGP